jgi:hypothetical protein
MIILASLLGVTAFVLTLYTITHVEDVPITGRKRFMFITQDQVTKIAEKQVEEVSIFCILSIVHYQCFFNDWQSVELNYVQQIFLRYISSEFSCRLYLIQNLSFYCMNEMECILDQSFQMLSDMHFNC